MIANVYQKGELNFVEVFNDVSLKVVFCDLGASIFNIFFNDELMTRNVKDIKDFKQPSCYYGKTIGRTNGRIEGNRITINGKTYTLENNEGLNVLHGGKSGLSNQKFTFRIEYYYDRVEVVFTYLSKDLEGGYPGNVDFEVRYSVYKTIDRIDIKYNAISDKDTLVSLTNHSYFSLGDKDISNLELMVKGSRYLDLDNDNLIPHGIKPVNEALDFSEYKKIVKDIDNNCLKGKMINGYDSIIYLDDEKYVSLRNDRYQLDINTDYDCLVMYTSNYRPLFKLDNDIQLRDSVALEPSDILIDRPILQKEEKYTRFISYTFNKVR